MNLWLYFGWPFLQLQVIFTDFSSERNDLIARFLTILTNSRLEIVEPKQAAVKLYTVTEIISMLS